MGTRADLAEAIENQLIAEAIDGVVVYDNPADVAVIPAVVIDAANPYIAIATFGGTEPGAVVWRFAVHLVAVRTDVRSAFDLIEALRAAVVVAAGSIGATPGELTKPETFTVNEQPTLQADLEVDFMTTNQT